MTERVKITRQKNKFKESLGIGDKVDVSKNSENLDKAIAEHQERDKRIRKYPLRINQQTVIFVRKEKCNEAVCRRL